MGIKLTTEEQMICEAIRTAIKTAKPKTTISEVAEKVGTTYDILSNIANGRTKPLPEIVDGVRDALNLPKTWPLQEPVQLQRRSINGTPLAPIKIVGAAAAGAGEFNVDFDGDDLLVPDRLVAISDIAFLITGDSMMPALKPGDVALFKVASRTKRRHTYLLKESSGEYRVKTVGYDKDHWTLESLNPSYEPEKMQDGTQVQGVLVAWYRTSGTRETWDSDSHGLILDPSDYFL